MTVLATLQTVITPDVRENGLHLRAAITRAVLGGARIVHAPEGALSGYIVSEVAAWDRVDWRALRRELRATAVLAERLGVWVVLGANHRLRAPRWPHNSLYVISDTGELAGRYDKRLCSNSETTYWYTPGVAPLVFEVDGIRFGCTLCIEVVFPHLFAEYERLGVQCILLSSYSADPVHGVMARAHAATNCMWVSLATPVACSRGLPTMVFGPDGHAAGACVADSPGMLLTCLDLQSKRYRVALQWARPWRARARDVCAGRGGAGFGGVSRGE